MSTVGQFGSDERSSSVELARRLTILERRQKATRSIASIALALSLCGVAPNLSLIWTAWAALSLLMLLEPWLKRHASFLPQNAKPEEAGTLPQFFRFRLMTLLLLVTASCLYVGVEVSRVRPELAEKNGVVALRKAVGPTMRTTYEHRQSVIAWILTGEYDYRVPTEVDIYTGQATDASLLGLRGLSRLRKLRLTGEKVTDAGIPYLLHLTRLKELDLTQTNVSADGLKQLRTQLPQCRVLR